MGKNLKYRIELKKRGSEHWNWQGGKSAEYDNANLHSLENGVNSGKLRKDNPEPSRVKTRKVQRLPEAGTPALITGTSAPHVSDEIVH